MEETTGWRKRQLGERVLRIGLFGGSFNPVHNGHIKLALAAAAELSLDKVFFVPAKRPPHKFTKKLAAAAHRKKMLSLAIEPYETFSISNFELARAGTTFTYQTLRYLRAKYPKAQIVLLLGSDSLSDVILWKRPRELTAKSVLVSAKRPGGRLKTPGWILERSVQLKCKMPGISSTEIRDKTAKGKSIKGLVPSAVAEYINKYALYN